MADVYSAEQTEDILCEFAEEIKLFVSPSRLKSEILKNPDTNFLSDQEKSNIQNIQTTNRDLVALYRSAMQ